MDVGFVIQSELLLVLCRSGRGLVDCATGRLIARDPDPDFAFDSASLTAAGIGPVQGWSVRVAGLHGGGLSLATDDGWSIERHPLAWPEEELFLAPPGEDMLCTPCSAPFGLTKFSGFDADVLAFGFSSTGRTLVIATSASVLAIAR